MFDTIISALEEIWKAISQLFQTVFDWVKPGFVWIMATFAAVMTITNEVIQFVWNNVLKLVDAAGHLTVPAGEAATASAGSAGDVLRAINTFFPVAEGFTFMSALTILWLAGLTYRFVKSWLPEIAGFGFPG